MLHLSNKLVLFDVDLTLLSVNSVRGWIKRERRSGRLGMMQTLRAGMHLLRYKYAGADMSKAIAEAISHLKGEQEIDFRERVIDYWQEEVSNQFRPGALTCLQSHLDHGHEVALLTSSSIYLAEAVAAHLNIPHVLAMRFEVVDGRFTGKPILPLCHGVGKLNLAQELANRLNLNLNDAFFYTDSMSDLPVLEAVGHPMLVHPDRPLRQYGLAQKWPILNWD